MYSIPFRRINKFRKTSWFLCYSKTTFVFYQPHLLFWGKSHVLELLLIRAAGNYSRNISHVSHGSPQRLVATVTCIGHFLAFRGFCNGCKSIVRNSHKVAACIADAPRKFLNLNNMEERERENKQK